MKTQTAAQTRKAELEAKYANRKFRIVDNSREMSIGKETAERDGMEIIEELPRGWVIAKFAAFDILEVRKCANCGTEILTAAIGEDGLSECDSCTEARKNRFESRMQTSTKRENDKVNFALNMY